MASVAGQRSWLCPWLLAASISPACHSLPASRQRLLAAVCLPEELAEDPAS